MLSNGINRFGVTGPPNNNAPAGGNLVTNNAGATPWYSSGPFWVIVFLIVGWVLVYQTVK